MYSLPFYTAWQSGVILCTNTEFENNLRSVFIRRGKFLNAIVNGTWEPALAFNGCTFEINDELAQHFDLNITPFFDMVRYQQNRGYTFQNCKFYNNTSNAEWADRGTAIRGIDAKFKVGGQVIPGEYLSEIIGFNRGVRVGNMTSFFHGFEVSKTHFAMNNISIQTGMVSFETLYQNFIEVGKPVVINGTPLPGLDEEEFYEGIFVHGGRGFEIAENSMLGFPTDENSTTVGIRIRDTNTSDDRVYRNDLTNLDYANLANGDNRSGIENNGLRYVCNDNTNNIYDFTITDFPGLIEQSSIGDFQSALGDEIDFDELAAGNHFTTDDPLVEFQHLWNEGEPFVYWYFPSGDQIPNGLDVEGSVTTTGDADPNGCPAVSHVINPEHIVQTSWFNQIVVLADDFFTQHQSTKFLYLSLLDEGDTQELEQEVIAIWGEDVLDMRDRLLDASPYLSLTILREVADHTEIYPHAIACEIFMANPEVLKNSQFMAYLSTKDDPMPQYMIDILRSASNQTTYRTIIEDELSLLKAAYSEKLDAIMRARMELDEWTEIDFIDHHTRMECLSSELEIVNYWLSLGNVGEAENRYYSIPDRIRLEQGSDLRDFDTFYQWLELCIELIHTNRDFQQLTPAEIMTLEDLSTEFYMYEAGRLAIGILNDLVEEEDLLVPPALPSGGLRSTNQSVHETLDHFLLVFPDPASNVVQIQLQLPEILFGPCKIIISDAQGRIIEDLKVEYRDQQFVVDVRNYTSGTYFMNLTNSPVESMKAKQFRVVH